MWEKENCSGQLTLLFTLAQALNFSFHLLSSLPPAFFMFVSTDDPPTQLASVSYPDFCSNLILLFDLLYHAVKTFRCKMLNKSKRLCQVLLEETVLWFSRNKHEKLFTY